MAECPYRFWIVEFIQIVHDTCHLIHAAPDAKTRLFKLALRDIHRTVILVNWGSHAIDWCAIIGNGSRLYSPASVHARYLYAQDH